MIIINQDINVAGEKGLSEIGTPRKNIAEKLIPRLKDYERILGIKGYKAEHLAKGKLTSDIREGKAVLFTDSATAQVLIELFPDFRLKLLNYKFSPRFVFSYISRKHLKWKLLYKM